LTLRNLKRNVKQGLNRARRRLPDASDIKRNLNKMNRIKVPEKARAGARAARAKATIATEKAREKHKKFQRQLQKNLPANGKQFGKQIERKLTSSQKIWRNVGVAFFSQKSLENISHFSSYLLGAMMLILVDIVMIFPTTREALALDALVMNFFVVLAGLLVVSAVTFVAMKAIGSKTKFKVFFSTSNTALFLSMLVFSIPIALVSFALFSTMLRSQQAINMFFSLIPFYNYLIYGWSSETLAKLKGFRSIIVALIALLLILFLNLLMPFFMA